MNDLARIGPERDPDSSDFWIGVDGLEIRLQRCLSCRAVRFPPLPSCPTCQSDRSETVVSVGRGVLYAWIVVRKPMGTISSDEVPCTIATVELEEGPRVLGRLSGVAHPYPDMPVEATYWSRDGWTELGFIARRSAENYA